MKRSMLALLASVALAGCATTSMHEAHHGSANEMRMAFDLTDANPQALATKLAVIDLTRKQLIEKGVTPKIVLAFRGDASYYTQTNLAAVKEADRAEALKIRGLIKTLSAAPGVQAVEQCNVPLAARKIKPADIMSEVKVVPNGWISLVEYQRQGYGYIAP